MKNKNIISCKDCTSTKCFMKQCLLSDNMQLIESKKYQSVHECGQYIIKEDSPIHGIFFLQQGKVKIFSGTNLKQQIVRLVTNGSSLCFRGYGRTTYLTSSSALEKTTVCFFKTDDFLYVCDKIKFGIEMMAHLTNELDITERRLKYLMQMNVREKVAEALLFIKESFGVNINNELDVYISRKDIAAIAGTSEELIIRHLSEFEKEKIIERRGKGKKIAILNENKLIQLRSRYDTLSVKR